MFNMDVSDFPPLPVRVATATPASGAPASVDLGGDEGLADVVVGNERPAMGASTLALAEEAVLTPSPDGAAQEVGDGDAGAVAHSPRLSSSRRYVTGDQSHLALSMARMTAWDHAGDSQAAIASRVARRASLDLTLGKRWYAKAFAADAAKRAADPAVQARVMMTRAQTRHRSGSHSPPPVVQAPIAHPAAVSVASPAGAAAAQGLLDAFLPARRTADTTVPPASSQPGQPTEAGNGSPADGADDDNDGDALGVHDTCTKGTDVKNVPAKETQD